MASYSPDTQVERTSDAERAYMGDSPALGLVRKTYGEGVALSWLAGQLRNLAEFAGCREKLGPGQIRELAQMMLDEYGHWKLTHFMLFFQKFKRGRFGRFYGSVDPITLFGALGEFAAERADEIDRYERLRERAERETMAQATEAMMRRLRDEYEAKVPRDGSGTPLVGFGEYMGRGYSRLSKEALSALFGGVGGKTA